MDTIYLHGLKADCVIGVWEWERRITQQVVVDVDMHVDIKQAVAIDDIKDALNYSDVATRVTELVRTSKFHLVESLASAIAELVLSEFGVKSVRVRVEKPGAVSAVRVGIIIERGECVGQDACLK